MDVFLLTNYLKCSNNFASDCKCKLVSLVYLDFNLIIAVSPLFSVLTLNNELICSFGHFQFKLIILNRSFLLLMCSFSKFGSKSIRALEIIRVKKLIHNAVL